MQCEDKVKLVFPENEIVKKIICIFILLLASAIAYPTLGVNYEQRRIAAKAIEDQVLLQSKIEKILLSCPHALNCYTETGATPLVGYRMVVDGRGVIELVLNNGTLIQLHPLYKSGKIEWQCTANKPKNVPPECR